MKRFIFAGLVILLLLVTSAPATFGPAITGISPSSGPNNGIVTITITGTGFDTLTQVRLNKCPLNTGGSGQPPFAGTVIDKSDTSITATFDLTNKATGDYDVSLNAPWEGINAWAVAPAAFAVYGASGSTPPPVTSAPVTTVTATATTTPPGENSVFFETWPPGAEISLDGEKVGTTPFTYYTNREGTFNVVTWMSGYEDYEARVTILEGKRVHFIAPLTVRSSATTTVTTKPPATTAMTTTPPVTSPTPTPTRTVTSPSGTTPATVTTTPPAMTPATPGKTPSPFRNSTITIPTPWATDPPAAEKTPIDPALAPGAVVLGILLVVIRRR